MQPDDELCLCFHVTLRKVQNFIRVEQPKVASQLSECGGAGTGCGWCRPLLRKLVEAQSVSGDGPQAQKAAELPASDAHRQGRQQHLRDRDRNTQGRNAAGQESDRLDEAE